jgi:hypothetical protein
VLGHLHQICQYAVRQGWIAENPVIRLERHERPAGPPERQAMYLELVTNPAVSRRSTRPRIAGFGGPLGQADVYAEVEEFVGVLTCGGARNDAARERRAPAAGREVARCGSTMPSNHADGGTPTKARRPGRARSLRPTGATRRRSPSTGDDWAQPSWP